jgi:hypothetical protein
MVINFLADDIAKFLTTGAPSVVKESHDLIADAVITFNGNAGLAADAFTRAFRELQSDAFAGKIQKGEMSTPVSRPCSVHNSNKIRFGTKQTKVANERPSTDKELPKGTSNQPLNLQQKLANACNVAEENRDIHKLHLLLAEHTKFFSNKSISQTGYFQVSEACLRRSKQCLRQWQADEKLRARMGNLKGTIDMIAMRSAIREGKAEGASKHAIDDANFILWEKNTSVEQGQPLPTLRRQLRKDAYSQAKQTVDAHYLAQLRLSSMQSV